MALGIGIGIGIAPGGGGASGPPLTTLKAFPTAEGFGKNTVGGRGGTVLFVDNLNDSGAGSFRAACEASGARIVIFRVGGIITLTSTINIDNPNITIAFQTAPGDGIMLSAEGTPNIPLIRVRTSQVIMRYPRFRRSASDTTETNSDCLVLTEGTDNCIIDHMSTSSAADEVLSIIGYSGDGDVDTKNITIQNSIIGKGYGGTTKGCLVSGAVDRLSFYRNLWVSNGQRNVLIKNDPGDGAIAETTFEFINNVIYDAKFKTSITCGDSSTGQKRLNYINNIYFEQSGGADQRRMIMVDNVDLPDTDVSIYALGNISPTRLTITTPTDFNEEWNITQGTDNNGGDTDLSSPSAYSRADLSFQSTSSFNTPIVTDNISILNADEIFNDIKDTVGASVPYRDAYDDSRISDVENLQQTFNSLSEPYQTYSSGTYPTDSNNDGIPDDYTTANMGTDTANDIAPSGYTWIEEYINSISADTNTNDDGLLLNGTFETSDDITLDSTWTIASEQAVYDGTGGTITFDISQNLTTGTDYTLTFDAPSYGSTLRFKLTGFDSGYGYTDDITGFTTYTPDGNNVVTVNFTTPSDPGRGARTDFRIRGSSISDAFTIDNVSLTLT